MNDPRDGRGAADRCVRVLYQRFAPRGAFSYIDDGMIGGYRELGSTVTPWLDAPGQPTLAEMLAQARPTHFVGCMQATDRGPCRWMTPEGLDDLERARRDTGLQVALRSSPSNIRGFFAGSGIDFASYQDAGVASFYTQPDRPIGIERELLERGLVDVVRTPLAREAHPALFRGFLTMGVRVVEEPHAADPARYRRLGCEPRCDATFIGGCWPFKWANMEGYITALQSRLGERFKVFGRGWPPGVSEGELDEAGFNRVVSASRVCISLHEPTQVLGFPFAQNERVFKLLAMGGAVVSDPNPMLRRQFEAGEEIMLTDSPEAMADAVAALRDDAPRAAAMGARGMRRVLAEHTYAHRAAALLRALRSPDPVAV